MGGDPSGVATVANTRTSPAPGAVAGGIQIFPAVKGNASIQFIEVSFDVFE
tara:strand:+ start:697 stop:849 length:153 start_codon:yes stop_codon:yes gene_type:complete